MSPLKNAFRVSNCLIDKMESESQYFRFEVGQPLGPLRAPGRLEGLSDKEQAEPNASFSKNRFRSFITEIR